MCAREVEQGDPWHLLLGRKQSLAGIIAQKQTCSQLCFLRRRFQRPPSGLCWPFSSAKTQQRYSRPFYLSLSSLFFVKLPLKHTLCNTPEGWHMPIYDFSILYAFLCNNWEINNTNVKLGNRLSRREALCREIRSQPPAKRVNCSSSAEQCWNALHCWEWTQVPTGLDKAPLPYAFFHDGCATMKKTLGHVRPG